MQETWVVPRKVFRPLSEGMRGFFYFVNSNKGSDIMPVVIPTNYDTKLSPRETQEAIRFIRETFQDEFGQQLNLSRLSAPMFVDHDTGLNDNLSGTETPVNFTMVGLPGHQIEIVHSLAKWKRMALSRFGFGMHEGLYTNMNAIRKDEELDNFHSIYVDQWDWEKVIAKDELNEQTLRETVEQIFLVMKKVESKVSSQYPTAVQHLPERIQFVTTQELEDKWPDKTPKERENTITKELGAVFLMQIGGYLKSGEKHDFRAPDYDNWELNGDILFWYEPLQRTIEISSMGIRVDEPTLRKQLKLYNAEDRIAFPFHQSLLNGKLPYTIGGGIGQSRVCMLLLGKAHVGEVQASIWPQAMIEECEAAGIHLL